jgi:hypothetical protein
VAKRPEVFGQRSPAVSNFIDLAIMKKAFFKKPGPAAGKP